MIFFLDSNIMEKTKIKLDFEISRNNLSEQLGYCEMYLGEWVILNAINSNIHFVKGGKITKHENEMQICKWTSLSSRLFDKSEDFCNMIPLSCISNWTPRLLQQKVVHFKRAFKFLPTHRGNERTTVRRKTTIYTSFNQN